jgi:hypothetical protein
VPTSYVNWLADVVLEAPLLAPRVRGFSWRRPPKAGAFVYEIIYRCGSYPLARRSCDALSSHVAAAATPRKMASTG